MHGLSAACAVILLCSVLGDMMLTWNLFVIIVIIIVSKRKKRYNVKCTLSVVASKGKRLTRSKLPFSGACPNCRGAGWVLATRAHSSLLKAEVGKKGGIYPQMHGGLSFRYSPDTRV